MNETAACLICSRSSRSRVCASCCARTDEDLAALPGHYKALEGVLAPGASGGDRVSGSRTPPLPVRLGPLTLRAGGSVVSVLMSWEDDWREILDWSKRPFRGTITQSVEGSSKFLRVNWPWAADKHPSPRDFAWEMRDLVGACKAEIDGKGDARQIGKCPTTWEDGTLCGSPLWASPYVTEIKCRKCRTTWPQDKWLTLAMSIRA